MQMQSALVTKHFYMRQVLQGIKACFTKLLALPKFAYSLLKMAYISEFPLAPYTSDSFVLMFDNQTIKIKVHVYFKIPW